MMIRRSTGRSPRGREAGSTLVWALVVSSVLVASAAAMTMLAGTTNRISKVREGQAKSRLLGLGALEIVAGETRTRLVNNLEPLASGSIVVEGNTIDYTLALQSPPEWVDNEDGLDALRTIYAVEARARVDGNQQVVRELMEVSLRPAFQYALFYEEDMHFLYPAPMEITGPVHCNSDIYLFAHVGLKFNTNYVRAAGSVHNDAAFGQWLTDYNWGDPRAVEVRQWVDDPYDATNVEDYWDLLTENEMDDLGIPNTSGYDSSFVGYDQNGDGSYWDYGDWLPFGPGALEHTGTPDFYAGSGDGSTLQTGVHGVGTLQLPPPESREVLVEKGPDQGDFMIVPGTGDYVEIGHNNGTHDYSSLYEQADLRIVSYENGTWKAFDSYGTNVTSDVAGAVQVSDIYDAREYAVSGENVPVLQVDMDALAASGRFPDNGLLYAGAWRGSTDTDVRGFQFHNASTLAADLTIVSPDSVYLQGNYNTSATKRSAVIADAVNLLSNSWNNSKTPGNLPHASNTSYVVSILTGDSTPRADNFNGGPHNLVRFHENWSGVTNSIRGSLVCMGHSVRADSPFQVYGDFYQAPNRNWSFDTDLNTPAGMPPFAPRFVEVSRLALW